MSDPGTSGPLDHATALRLLEQADELAAAGEYGQVRIYASRLVGNPDPEIHVAALLRLADAHYRLDDEDAAMAAWTAAAKAPETRFAWLAWKQLAEARVRGGDIRGALEAYRQAERRAPPSERGAIASRLGWLSKDLGDERAAGRYFARARGRGFVPWVSYAILAVTIGIGLAEFVIPQGQDVFVQGLALLKGLVARGEWYRLVSVVLVHDPTDPLHLAFNMYALWLVGPIVEELFGHARYLLLYVLLAAAASTLSYVILPQDAVGASGAIFGLFGMLFVTMRVYHPVLDRRARALVGQIGFLIVLNLLLGFGLMGAGVGIDNFAHIGGLLAGCWLALAIPPRAATTLAGAFQRPGTTASRTLVPVLFQAAAVVALVAVIAAGVAYGTAERESGTMPVSNASHTVVMRAPD